MMTLDPVRNHRLSHRGTIDATLMTKQTKNGDLDTHNFYAHKRQKTVEREKKPRMATNQNDSLLDKWEKQYWWVILLA